MGVQERIVAQEEAAPPGKMTYEAFLAWLDEDTLAEWVDGAVIMTSPASKVHQALGRFLLQVLDVFVRFRGLGEIIQPPFQMKLKHGREPDLIFVATANLDRLKNTFLDGPADLVIEIVSPESIARDRGDKFVEYEAGGVPEYWLFDPERRSADFYQLTEGRYRTAFSGQSGIYHSAVLPGFWLDVGWLWQEPLPSPFQALAQIVGMEPALLEAFERALGGAPDEKTG